MGNVNFNDVLLFTWDPYKERMVIPGSDTEMIQEGLSPIADIEDEFVCPPTAAKLKQSLKTPPLIDSPNGLAAIIGELNQTLAQAPSVKAAGNPLELLDQGTHIVELMLPLNPGHYKNNIVVGPGTRIMAQFGIKEGRLIGGTIKFIGGQFMQVDSDLNLDATIKEIHITDEGRFLVSGETWLWDPTYMDQTEKFTKILFGKSSETIPYKKLSEFVANLKLEDEGLVDNLFGASYKIRTDFSVDLKPYLGIPLKVSHKGTLLEGYGSETLAPTRFHLDRISLGNIQLRDLKAKMNFTQDPKTKAINLYIHEAAIGKLIHHSCAVKENGRTILSNLRLENVAIDLQPKVSGDPTKGFYVKSAKGKIRSDGMSVAGGDIRVAPLWLGINFEIKDGKQNGDFNLETSASGLYFDHVNLIVGGKLSVLGQEIGATCEKIAIDHKQNLGIRNCQTVGITRLWNPEFAATLQNITLASLNAQVTPVGIKNLSFKIPRFQLDASMHQEPFGFDGALTQAPFGTIYHHVEGPNIIGEQDISPGISVTQLSDRTFELTMNTRLNHGTVKNPEGTFEIDNKPVLIGTTQLINISDNPNAPKFRLPTQSLNFHLRNADINKILSGDEKIPVLKNTRIEIRDSNRKGLIYIFARPELLNTEALGLGPGLEAKPYLAMEIHVPPEALMEKEGVTYYEPERIDDINIRLFLEFLQSSIGTLSLKGEAKFKDLQSRRSSASVDMKLSKGPIALDDASFKSEGGLVTLHADVEDLRNPRLNSLIFSGQLNTSTVETKDGTKITIGPWEMPLTEVRFEEGHLQLPLKLPPVIEIDTKIPSRIKGEIRPKGQIVLKIDTQTMAVTLDNTPLNLNGHVQLIPKDSSKDPLTLSFHNENVLGAKLVPNIHDKTLSLDLHLRTHLESDVSGQIGDLRIPTGIHFSIDDLVAKAAGTLNWKDLDNPTFDGQLNFVRVNPMKLTLSREVVSKLTGFNEPLTLRVFAFSNQPVDLKVDANKKSVLKLPKQAKGFKPFTLTLQAFMGKKLLVLRTRTHSEGMRGVWDAETGTLRFKIEDLSLHSKATARFDREGIKTIRLDDANVQAKLDQLELFLDTRTGEFTLDVTPPKTKEIPEPPKEYEAWQQWKQKGGAATRAARLYLRENMLVASPNLAQLAADQGLGPEGRNHLFVNMKPFRLFGNIKNPDKLVKQLPELRMQRLYTLPPPPPTGNEMFLKEPWWSHMKAGGAVIRDETSKDKRVFVFLVKPGLSWEQFKGNIIPYTIHQYLSAVEVSYDIPVPGKKDEYYIITAVEAFGSWPGFCHIKFRQKNEKFYSEWKKTSDPAAIAELRKRVDLLEAAMRRAKLDVSGNNVQEYLQNMLDNLDSVKHVEGYHIYDPKNGFYAHSQQTITTAIIDPPDTEFLGNAGAFETAMTTALVTVGDPRVKTQKSIPVLILEEDGKSHRLENLDPDDAYSEFLQNK